MQVKQHANDLPDSSAEFANNNLRHVFGGVCAGKHPEEEGPRLTISMSGRSQAARARRALPHEMWR